MAERHHVSYQPAETYEEQQPDILPEPFERVFVDGEEVGALHSHEAGSGENRLYAWRFSPGESMRFGSGAEAKAWIAAHTDELLPDG